MKRTIITISAEPLIAAYGEEAVNEILRRGRRIDENVVRVPAVEVFRVLWSYSYVHEERHDTQDDAGEEQERDAEA